MAAWRDLEWQRHSTLTSLMALPFEVPGDPGPTFSILELWDYPSKKTVAYLDRNNHAGAERNLCCFRFLEIEFSGKRFSESRCTRGTPKPFLFAPEH